MSDYTEWHCPICGDEMMESDVSGSIDGKQAIVLRCCGVECGVDDGMERGEECGDPSSGGDVARDVGGAMRDADVNCGVNEPMIVNTPPITSVPPALHDAYRQVLKEAEAIWVQRQGEYGLTDFEPEDIYRLMKVKVSRLIKGQASEDSLLDLLNYAAIGLMVMRGEWKV